MMEGREANLAEAQCRHLRPGQKNKKSCRSRENIFPKLCGKGHSEKEKTMPPNVREPIEN